MSNEEREALTLIRNLSTAGYFNPSLFLWGYVLSLRSFVDVRWGKTNRREIRINQEGINYLKKEAHNG